MEQIPLLQQVPGLVPILASEESENFTRNRCCVWKHKLDNDGTCAYCNSEEKGDPTYNPYLHRYVENPTTNCETAIHLLKANIGAGILAMPDAFKNAGLLTGTVATFIIGFLCVHAMALLVKCSQDLCRRIQRPFLTFSEVAEAAFKLGPLPLRRFSTWARIIVDVFLCAISLGACCVYFVFISENIKHVVDPYVNTKWPIQIYMILILLPMIILNFIRNLKVLAPFSLVANALMTVGLGIILFYIFREPLPSIIDRPKFNAGFASWNTLALYFGTTIYAFEGIGMVLPLENNMKTPQDFGGRFGVLNKSMLTVLILYILVGFFGYWKYGYEVTGSITLNLNEGEVLAQIVRGMMAIAIFFTYPLLLYVPLTIMWPLVSQRVKTKRLERPFEFLFRGALVCLTFAVAELIPNLGVVISLVGAVAGSALSLIFPGLINILCRYRDGYEVFKWYFWKDVALIGIGILGAVAGTLISFRAILKGPGPHELADMMA